MKMAWLIDPLGPSEAKQAKRGDRKFLIRDTLRVDAGMTPRELQQSIIKQHGIAVSTNTISVTLPRLRTEGHARLNGRHWFRVEGHAETAESSSTEQSAVPTTTNEEPSDEAP